MKNILKAIDLLEQNGCYRLADLFQDQLVKTAAWPYNLSAIDELPLSARFYTWQRNEQDFNEFDRKFYKELYYRLPDYRNLKTDSDEKLNMEGEMHGEDPTPGPAYVDPVYMVNSPSMNGSLDYFTWDQAHDINQGPEYWKNLKPRG